VGGFRVYQWREHRQSRGSSVHSYLVPSSVTSFLSRICTQMPLADTVLTTGASCSPTQEIRYISLNQNVQCVFCDPYAKLHAYLSQSPILFIKPHCVILLSVSTPSKRYVSFRLSAHSRCSIMSSKTSNDMFQCHGTGCSLFKCQPTLKMVLKPS
jgi:hypothetical protein